MSDNAFEGVESLAPWAWRLPLETPTLPPATATNTLVVGNERLLVIEPGTPHDAEFARLESFLERMQAQGRVVMAVAITHHHPDHTGSAVRLSQRFDVPIYAHPQTAARVDFPVEGMLEDGDSIDLGSQLRIDAVLTPGHAPGHLMFVEPTSGVAHAGDLVAAEGTILIDPDDSGDMAQYLNSLELAKELDIKALVPAHGPTQRRPLELFERYIAHRLAREAKVLRAVDQRDEFEAVLAIAYEDAPKAIWELARKSLRAHLDKLVAEGRVVRDGDHLELS